mgnify:CR=1
MNLKKIENEIKKKYKEVGCMSTTYIMRKYRVSPESASNMLDILSKSTCRSVINNNIHN